MYQKLLLVAIGMLLAACSNNNSTNLPTLAVLDQAVAQVSSETEEPAETPELIETEEPAETPELVETEEPAETPELVETEEPAETPELIETEEIAPPNADGYYVAPSYATVEEGLSVEDAPSGSRWIMTTVTLGNESGSPILVNSEDIWLIGNDGVKYATGEMIERASPTLVGSNLMQDESVYGFAIFALPNTVEPKVFEWCVAGNCETPLQAPISLQED